MLRGSHRDFLNAEWKDPSLSEEERAHKRLIYTRQRNKVTSMIRAVKKSVVDGMTRTACGDQSRIWEVVC